MVGRIFYTINIKNDGTRNANNVTLTDVLPTGTPLSRSTRAQAG